MTFVLGILAGAFCSVGFLLWCCWPEKEWTEWKKKSFAYTRDGESFCGWFRIFGRGFALTDHRIYPMLFSERYGYTKAIHFGPYCVRWLGKMRFLRGEDAR